MQAILIYDDNCNVCNTFATGGKKNRVLSLGYSTSEAQKLMNAQFGKDFGFVLMLFTEYEVHWGPVAARESARLSYSSWVKDILYMFYPAIVKTLNIVLRRERLPEPPKIKGERLKQGGSMPLTEKAYRQVTDLLETYSSE